MSEVVSFGDRTYVREGGTCFNVETPEKVRQVINSLMHTPTRVRIYCGDTATGEAWQEEHDVMGRIGRSTGPCKIPLLIANARSRGGPGLLDACILRIVRLSDKAVLYSHPAFTLGEWTVEPRESGAHSVLHNGQEFAREGSAAKAEKLRAFMAGERNAK